jgi:membrane protein
MVTSALFMLGNYVISFYISRTATTSVYGVAGSLVAILLWVYYSAQIFLFGAEFTQVYANKYGREVRPDDNAVRVQRPGGDPQAQPAPRQAEG